MKFLEALLLALPLTVICKLNKEAFFSDSWVPEETNSKNERVKFMLAFKGRNHADMHDEFLSVSSPKSSKYGAHLSLSEVHEKYGVKDEDKQLVLSVISQKIEGSVVECGDFSDLCSISAEIGHIERGFDTKLMWHSHKRNLANTKRSLRAVRPLAIDEKFDDLISFISLNAPVNHMVMKAAESKSEMDMASVGVISGNKEAVIDFVVTCENGELNTDYIPCSSTGGAPIMFNVAVTAHANNLTNPYLLTTDPILSTSINASGLRCFNSNGQACNGTVDQGCKCHLKLSPLSKYMQLQTMIQYTYGDTGTGQTLVSDFFALTDVATASFLSTLYNIPKGIRADHGSNQSVAEFYGQFYSNSDLVTFLALSGLPTASIPNSNVYGDLPNNQSIPGGEAQLDVEYIMALAPGADTYFYSMGDYNPNNPVNVTLNEGFLAYLQLVANQTYPPLVHSLSYGDVEAVIFNSSNPYPGYGYSCDAEFMKMGLRGLTVVFSSGDDGIGNTITGDDPTVGCSQAWPAWPASSPYVTTVGATQMTDKYLPACGMPYSTNLEGTSPSEDLLLECTGTGETVCSSSFGGIITSGGGFSDYANRNQYAPWQAQAVDQYLSPNNSAAYPPLSYFNSSGRAYPDVSTYGSNYFVYLNGKIVRESGTSASAPVFAAMVTLWNDMRLAYGQPPLGFIAPFLYEAQASNPEAFQDVTTGDNACAAGYSLSTVNCCEYSFAASPGWDAATGLGSPNYGVIANLVLNNLTYFPAIAAYPSESDIQSLNDLSYSDDDGVEKTADISFWMSLIALVCVLLLLVLKFYEVVTKKEDGGSTQTPLLA